MHEVGHTLGLRHNFRASAAYSWDQLANESFVAEKGFTSSVMDYSPAFIPSNRSLQSKSAAGFVSTVVGAYDKHAIEYGYRVVEGERDGVQPPELALLASRGASDVELAFSTDEDGPRLSGIDPLTNVYDLGNDPIAFYKDRLALAQRLLATAANRTVLHGESWTKQIGAINSFMNIALRAGSYASKSIGGTLFSKAHKGDPHAADSMTPVAPAEQARALELVLQIVAQPFWLPAAQAVAQMPKRDGFGCGELQEYCVGLSRPAILVRVRSTRVRVLLQLLQSVRLSGLAQHEWELDGDDVDEDVAPPPPPSFHIFGEGLHSLKWGSYQTEWVSEPQSIPSVAKFAARPSITTLLGAIDDALASPNASTVSTQRPSSLKMVTEMQRIWLALLKQLSGRQGEEGAAAVQLLRALEVDTDGRLSAISAAGSGAIESPSVSALHAHLLWLRHELNSWESTVQLSF